MNALKTTLISLAVFAVGTLGLSLTGFYGHKVFGAITSPASNFNYGVFAEAVDSPLLRLTNSSTVPVSIQSVRVTAVTGTTTPCAMQNPLNATSTLFSASMNITTGTGTAVQYVIATSTTAFATTSVITTQTIAANSQGIVGIGEFASSTGLMVVVPPTGYVNVGVALGSGSGGLVNVGATCSAVFQSIN